MVSFMTRNQVESALAAHGSREQFNRRIADLAVSQGVSISAADIVAMGDLGERYVRETLRLLEACATAADQAHAARMLDPLIDACERFFLQPCQGAPDQSGLLGMICDAYLSRCLIAEISERMRNVRGFPMIATDPHPEAPVVRAILGSDVTSTLEDAVTSVVDGPQVRYMFNAAYGLQGPLRASGRVSDWSESWEQEMSSRCAAAGIALAA